MYNVTIRYLGKLDDEALLSIRELQADLRDNLSESVNPISQSGPPGQKADLLTGLAVAGIALNTVQTIFAVLAWWEAKRTRIEATASQGSQSVALDLPALREAPQKRVELPNNIDREIEIVLKDRA